MSFTFYWTQSLLNLILSTIPTFVQVVSWWKRLFLDCIWGSAVALWFPTPAVLLGWGILDPQLRGVETVVQFKWKNQPWCCYSPYAHCWQGDLSQGRWYTSINTLWSLLNGSVWPDGSTQINRRESPFNANVFCPAEICNWNTITSQTCRTQKPRNIKQNPGTRKKQ